MKDKVTKKTAVKKTVAKQNSVQNSVTTKSDALKIWEEVKGLDLNLFALEDQTLEKHSDPVFNLSDKELYILLKTDAALPQLEELLRRSSFDVEQRDRFVVIKRT